jgi:hypothetical protein
MIASVRSAFNAEFTEEKYQAFLNDIHSVHPGAIEFRLAETPVFVPKAFTQQMLDCCEAIVDLIVDPKFKKLTQRAIPTDRLVPNENDHTDFIAFDFGVCENAEGVYEPQLIEMQGFPTLFGFQVLNDEKVREHFNVPQGFDSYLGGFDRTSYIDLLRRMLLGDEKPDNVVLLELFPHQQKTKIDFYCTEDYTGVRPISLTDVIREGQQLFYMRDGVTTRITRIYNRIIFDDLDQQPEEVREMGKMLFEPLDVQWVSHPNWFYRISKFTLPFIRHPFVPQTFFLNELKQVPADLENYVLKPLFSFAGQGVIIDIKPGDVENISDPENWILQRKVKYADAIKTPEDPAKTEIRIFYFWEKGAERPVPTNNLSRLSKGKMIGVRYNKDKSWVGGTLCYFEK